MFEEFMKNALLVFKIIAALGFVVAGVFIIGISYRKFNEYFGPEADKYKWMFWFVVIIISLLLIFIFVVLFDNNFLATVFV